jgi:hypothetical protein
MQKTLVWKTLQVTVVAENRAQSLPDPLPIKKAGVNLVKFKFFRFKNTKQTKSTEFLKALSNVYYLE